MSLFCSFYEVLMFAFFLFFPLNFSCFFSIHFYNNQSKVALSSRHGTATFSLSISNRGRDRKMRKTSFFE